MHIPDGFLSPAIWVTMDAAAAPAAAWCARRSRAQIDESRVPLLGVMGAFVFAAQMINFPVAPGASGHIVGAALMAVLFGPCTAALVMAAVLLIQALLFQDGGITALGANFWNMGLAGVFLGYLPYWLSCRAGGRLRSAALFLGGWLAVVGGAAMAAAELSFSHVASPRLLFVSLLGVHALTGLGEGAITVAAVRMIEKLNPKLIGGAVESA
jgi:cobalt/nickel transport system permease protein